MTRRRISLWSGLGLVVVVLLTLALWPQRVEVDAAAATRAPLESTLDHEGKTRVRERYEISVPAAGTILRIELEPGDPVVADETVLATLVPSTPVPLDARSRAEAEAALAAARASLAQAEAGRDRAMARHDYAAAEWRRKQALRTEGLLSEDEAEAVEASARAAAQDLAAASALVETAGHEVARARAALLEPGPVEHGATTLTVRSPVDGVVLERLKQSSAVVAAGVPLLVIGDPANLEVVSDYLSTDAVNIRPGMRVEIERWGGDGALGAIVRRVEPHGFLKVSALGVEEQRVNVITDFTDPRDRWESLGDGYRVETRVVTWSGDAVLQVPLAALFRHDGRWSVFAIRDGRARLVEVELGHRGADAGEIVSGLAEGDRVVLHPPDSVGDGTRVAPRPAGPASGGS